MTIAYKISEDGGGDHYDSSEQQLKGMYPIPGTGQ